MMKADNALGLSRRTAPAGQCLFTAGKGGTKPYHAFAADDAEGTS